MQRNHTSVAIMVLWYVLVGLIIIITMISCANDVPSIYEETPKVATKPFLTGDISERAKFTGHDIWVEFLECGKDNMWIANEWIKLDKDFLAYSLAEVYFYILTTQYDQKIYNKYFDCDDFVKAFVGGICQAMEGVAIGLAVYQNHAVAMFYDYYGERIIFIDPQIDSIEENNDIVLSLKYVILSVSGVVSKERSF